MGSSEVVRGRRSFDRLRGSGEGVWEEGTGGGLKSDITGLNEVLENLGTVQKVNGNDKILE